MRGSGATPQSLAGRALLPRAWRYESRALRPCQPLPSRHMAPQDPHEDVEFAITILGSLRMTSSRGLAVARVLLACPCAPCGIEHSPHVRAACKGARSNLPASSFLVPSENRTASRNVNAAFQGVDACPRLPAHLCAPVRACYEPPADLDRRYFTKIRFPPELLLRRASASRRAVRGLPGATLMKWRHLH